jgi:hypothetical protein
MLLMLLIVLARLAHFLLTLVPGSISPLVS